jgi:histidinol-phosphate aminotransferase
VVERMWVEDEIRVLGLRTSDSQANFSWIDLGDHDEAAVVESLGKSGVIVRAGEGLGGPGHIRVTYGTREENERFIEALQGGLDA